MDIRNGSERNDAKSHKDPRRNKSPACSLFPPWELGDLAACVDAHEEVEIAQRVKREKDRQDSTHSEKVTRDSLLVRHWRSWFGISLCKVRYIATSIWRYIDWMG